MMPLAFILTARRIKGTMCEKTRKENLINRRKIEMHICIFDIDERNKETKLFMSLIIKISLIQEDY